MIDKPVCEMTDQELREMLDTFPDIKCRREGNKNVVYSEPSDLEREEAKGNDAPE